MKEEKDNPTLRAIKIVKKKPNATMSDAPWQRPILAGNHQAIKRAGEEAREIFELRENFPKDEEPKKPSIEKPGTAKE